MSTAGYVKMFMAEHPSLGQLAATTLRRMIIDGDLRPGERLVEQALADRLGVSRAPLREALRTLERERFIEIRARRGASVSTMSPADVADLFEVRAAVELLVADLAARRCTADDLAVLDTIVASARSLLADELVDSLPALNTSFHQAVARASGNLTAIEVLLRLGDRIEWVYSQRVGHRATGSWDEHEEILAAIAAHDPMAARQLTAQHVQHAAAALGVVWAGSIDGTERPRRRAERKRPSADRPLVPPAP